VSLVCGIDPGLHGAIAFLSGDCRNPRFYDMPTVGKEANPSQISEILLKENPDVVVLESVFAHPKQGVSSVWRFAHCVGILQGVIAASGLPLVRVSPARWKRDLRLSSDKEMCRQRAIDLWPEASNSLKLKKDSDRAEAVLLAYWHHLSLVL
jgi:crossover junction endodeoxyribonuclease RuvC